MLSVENNVSVLGDLRSRQLFELKNARHTPASSLRYFDNIKDTGVMKNEFVSQIRSPVLAPSAISSENSLQAKNAFSPFYVHDQARSRYLRVSTSWSANKISTGQVDLIA